MSKGRDGAHVSADVDEADGRVSVALHSSVVKGCKVPRNRACIHARTQLNQPMTCASPAVQSSAEYGRSVKET
jgi:hypothetical protein